MIQFLPANTAKSMQPFNSPVDIHLQKYFSRTLVKSIQFGAGSVLYHYGNGSINDQTKSKRRVQ
jgi:hypothetical protein